MSFEWREYGAERMDIEVPLSASLYIRVKLPLLFWNISGRIQWYFNNSRQKESRLQTEKRAMQFVKMLMEKNNE